MANYFGQAAHQKRTAQWKKSLFVSKRLFAGILFALASGTGCYANSILSNPGFESGVPGQKVPGWSSYGGNAYIINDSGIARNGTNCLKVYQGFAGAVNYT